MSTLPRRRRCVAIMAGGRGLRLWPRSSARVPKQFHAFFGMPILLQQTLERTRELAAPAATYVVTTRDLLPEAARLSPPEVRLVAEPCGRDTAACAGLAALRAEHDHPGCLLTLLPADHWVGDPAAFAQTLTRAADVAETEDCLVTVGVRPTRPETGYGYLLVHPGESGVLRGKKFREKPSAEEAARLIAAGDAWWNAGIFVARAATLLELIRRYEPELAAGLNRIAASLGAPEEERVMDEVYRGLRQVSFDHGVAEHLPEFRVVPGEFAWDDLGSWAAFGRQLARDEAGNLTAGAVHAFEASGCQVDTPGLRTVLLGVNDLIVVQEGDWLLIADPNKAQDVKRIAASLGLAQPCGAQQPEG